MVNEHNYVTLTDENFEEEVLKSDTLVIVDFWAPWCGPCRVLGPVIEELANDFKGQVKVGKLNVDDSPRTAQRFAIRSIPTVLFISGGQVVDGVIGALPKPALVEKISSLVPAA